MRYSIEKANFKTEYFYMLLTYGNKDTVTGIWSKNFCRENVIHVYYIQTIKMGDIYFQVSICIDKHEDEQIEKAIQDIKQNTKYIPISSKEEIEVYKMVSKKSLNTQKW